MSAWHILTTSGDTQAIKPFSVSWSALPTTLSKCICCRQNQYHIKGPRITHGCVNISTLGGRGMYLVDPEKLLKRHVRHRPVRAEHWVEVCAQGI